MTSAQHTTNYELDIGKTTVQHCVETGLLRHTHALQLIRFKTLTPKKWTSEKHLTWMKWENWPEKLQPNGCQCFFILALRAIQQVRLLLLHSGFKAGCYHCRCSALIPPVYLSLQSTIQLLHLARWGHYQVQTAWGEAELIDLDSWIDWQMKVKIDTGLEPNGSHSAKALWQVMIHIGKKKFLARANT